MTGRRGTPEERFWRFVHPEPNSGCWLWLGAVDRHGYGQLRIARRGPGALRYASHISLELAGRMVPIGLDVCHHCDNPPCVNPDHLFVGTARDNIADCISKGRHSSPPHSRPGQGMQELCWRGHPLSGDNLFLTSTGRGCRACRQLRKVAFRARRKAAGLTTRGTIPK